MLIHHQSPQQLHSGSVGMASAPDALPTLSRPATSQPALARGVSSAVLRPRSRGELTEVLDLEDQARRAFIVNPAGHLGLGAGDSGH